jgi:hypothetical protein
MKINDILSHIDSGYMALPEFQRGYVWNGDQVRKFFTSLYRKHPVGGLLVWVTQSKGAVHRGGGELAPGVVKLLLDGQQRMTSLYGVVRGRPPKFFDGNAKAFTGLHFHLETEEFRFYQPKKMKDDPLWINVTTLMQSGNAGLGGYVTELSAVPDLAPKVGDYVGRLSSLLAILEIDLHIEEVTGEDKTLDVVVDIFNRVNSGGTKLSRGDLALAKICAEWPEARDRMKLELKRWEKSGYSFNLDWLLRSVNTLLTGEAKFQYLHDRDADEVHGALDGAVKHIDSCLNHIAGRLGLDHNRVMFARNGIPVMVRYLEDCKKTGGVSGRDWDKLLFWYAQSGMWGRFSGSTESYIDQDLEALDNETDQLDRLVEQLRLWHGGLRVEPGHFRSGWSLGARFYPVLYMITRMGEAKDWGDGSPLKAHLLGKMSSLQVHHIFPKAQLYKFKGVEYNRTQVNALGNFCFLTQTSNLKISDRKPEEYFPEIRDKYPGALESQWIPMEEELWRLENFPAFLEARCELLAAEVNRHMKDLLHGENHWLSGTAPAPVSPLPVPGAIADEEEEALLESLRSWMTEKSLPDGELAYELSDEETGAPQAILDLAWPKGIQEELSTPVAVLLNEGPKVRDIAGAAGFRVFASVEAFQRYVDKEILGDDEEATERSGGDADVDKEEEPAGNTDTKTPKLSDRQQQHLAYWNRFYETLRTSGTTLKLRSPRASSESVFAVGITNCGVVCKVKTHKQQLKAIFFINDREDAEFLYRSLEQDKAAIESEMGEPLIWDAGENKKGFAVYYLLENVNPADESDWPQQHAWIKEKLEQLQAVITPRVKAMIQE